MTRYCFGMVQTELIVFEYEYLFLIPLLFCCCLLCWVRSGDVFFLFFFRDLWVRLSSARCAAARPMDHVTAGEMSASRRG